MSARIIQGISLCFLLWIHTAQAAMRLDKTRVIVTETSPHATVQIESTGSQPLLIQAWISVKENEAQQASVITPFLLDPPVMRVDAGQTRTLQVLLSHLPVELPSDRESLFWLNVLEIPSGVESTAHRLHISVLSHLKLFYRPQAIADLPAPHLHFSWIRTAQQNYLVIENPAAHYQTLAYLRVETNGEMQELEAPMLAPFETLRVPVGSVPPQISLHFAVLDDHGNAIEEIQHL